VWTDGPAADAEGARDVFVTSRLGDDWIPGPSVPSWFRKTAYEGICVTEACVLKSLYASAFIYFHSPWQWDAQLVIS